MVARRDAYGTLALSIPTGALSQDTEITILRRDPSSLRAQLDIAQIDLAYELLPDGHGLRRRWRRQPPLHLRGGQASVAPRRAPTSAYLLRIRADTGHVAICLSRAPIEPLSISLFGIPTLAQPKGTALYLGDWHLANHAGIIIS